jgi:hypothetical protein
MGAVCTVAGGESEAVAFQLYGPSRPAVASELIELGERLRIAVADVAAKEAIKKPLYAACWEGIDVNSSLPFPERHQIFDERAEKNGYRKAHREWSAALEVARGIAETIFDTPTNDPIGDGIRAYAALVIDERDCDNGWNMRDVLLKMAERAGFERPEEDEEEEEAQLTPAEYSA